MVRFVGRSCRCAIAVDPGRERLARRHRGGTVAGQTAPGRVQPGNLVVGRVVVHGCRGLYPVGAPHAPCAVLLFGGTVGCPPRCATHVRSRGKWASTSRGLVAVAGGARSPPCRTGCLRPRVRPVRRGWRAGHRRAATSGTAVCPSQPSLRVARRRTGEGRLDPEHGHLRHRPRSDWFREYNQAIPKSLTNEVPRSGVARGCP